jgi:hypothetical protein
MDCCLVLLHAFFSFPDPSFLLPVQFLTHGRFISRHRTTSRMLLACGARTESAPMRPGPFEIAGASCHQSTGACSSRVHQRWHTDVSCGRVAPVSSRAFLVFRARTDGGCRRPICGICGKICVAPIRERPLTRSGCLGYNNIWCGGDGSGPGGPVDRVLQSGKSPGPPSCTRRVRREEWR